jgi:predicted transcriptional regulator
LPEFDWHAYGVVVGSEYRKSVVAAMEPGPRTPKQIATTTGLHLSHVSTTLDELTNEKVVVCLTPELRKGKLFQLTDLGREIAKRLNVTK